MAGFFSAQQTRSKSRPDGKLHSCASCGLYQFASSPRMPPFGQFKKRILNIGEAPGEVEDQRGKQWQGKTGRVLKRAYSELGVDLFGDCLNINTINCRPVNNKQPTDQEIACCRKRVLQVIEHYQPRVIILLGGSAVKCLIGHRWKKNLGGISKWRGWTIPDHDFDAWVCPVFHPSYVERQAGFDEVRTVWMQDLKRALEMVKVPLPQSRNKIEIVESRKDIITLLKDLRQQGRMTAFDIETTGLKPHNITKHQIVCASFCNDKDKAYAIPWPTERKLIARIRWLLTDLQVPKVAHNLKYEWAWLNVLHNIVIKPFVWDSMQAAHILDNRPQITSLKFQACVNYGVYDYDSAIEDYLKGIDPKNANSTNRILELWGTAEGRRKCMTYCGEDSLHTYRLAKKQMKQIGFMWD